MFSRLLNLIFRCRHQRTSFPQTVGGKTHVCCLDCGAELPYSWERMTVLPEQEAARDRVTGRLDSEKLMTVYDILTKRK